MKILAPVNKSSEVEKIIKEGADEIYCGVLPPDWVNKYTNVAASNRREWTSANLPNFAELEKTVNIAHTYHIPVYLTLNTFYTRDQYPLIFQHIEEAKRVGIDALIVGDLGLLLALRKMKLDIEIHISNTGTAFNSETVEFYKELGARRIIFCRHLMINEISELVKGEDNLQFEVFVLNSGCKNIDGFCTFHHGVNEINHPFLWNFFKKLNCDRLILECIRRLPGSVSSRIKGNISGIDSACLLNYEVSLISDASVNENNSSICRTISEGFSLISGADPCGVCDLYQLKKINMYSIKIVGRNYSTDKKISDIKFLKRALLILDQNPDIAEAEFKTKVKEEYANIYKMNCDNFCYRFSVS